jgi:hypothetical protein
MMTQVKIIEKVYEEMIEQAVRQLFSVLILEDLDSHTEAQRHFLNALDAATFARKRAMSIIGI